MCFKCEFHLIDIYLCLQCHLLVSTMSFTCVYNVIYNVIYFLDLHYATIAVKKKKKTSKSYKTSSFRSFAWYKELRSNLLNTFLNLVSVNLVLSWPNCFKLLQILYFFARLNLHIYSFAIFPITFDYAGCLVERIVNHFSRIFPFFYP